MDIQELLEEYINDVDHNLEKKGKRLHNKFSDEIILKNLDDDEAELIIPSESSDESYSVSILPEPGDGNSFKKSPTQTILIRQHSRF